LGKWGREKKWEEMITKEVEGGLKERGKRWKEAREGKVGYSEKVGEENKKKEEKVRNRTGRRANSGQG
jgi:hypothetical protein